MWLIVAINLFEPLSSKINKSPASYSVRKAVPVPWIIVFPASTVAVPVFWVKALASKFFEYLNKSAPVLSVIYSTAFNGSVVSL